MQVFSKSANSWLDATVINCQKHDQGDLIRVAYYRGGVAMQKTVRVDDLRVPGEVSDERSRDIVPSGGYQGAE